MRLIPTIANGYLKKESGRKRERESNDDNNGCLAMLPTQSQDVVSRAETNTCTIRLFDRFDSI